MGREGRIGNQILSRGNKALANHIQDGKEVFLFKQREGRMYEFIDQMICIDVKWDRGIDINDEIRNIIIFYLTRIENVENPDATIHSLDENDDDLKNLRRIALSDIEKAPSVKEQLRNYWRRSIKLKKYVLLRSEGICEACLQKAPFITNNNLPYLEVHHIKSISDGGLESPLFLAAVCPNCHRRAHYSIDKSDLNNTLALKINEKEFTLEKKFKYNSRKVFKV